MDLPPSGKISMLRAVLFVAVLAAPVFALPMAPDDAATQQRSDQTAPDIALHPRAASRQEIEDFNAARSVIGGNSSENSANDFADKISRK